MNPARVDVARPGEEHYARIRVRYAETDRMGVAYNSHYLTWFEVGRIEFLRGIGHPYGDMERRGFLLPVVEAGVKYLKPAFFDDVLTIETCLGQQPGARLFLEYRAVRDGETIAVGFTVHAFTDPELRPVKPPRDLLDVLRTHWEFPPESKRSLS
jgi:acyl-CoA thioester hydrolase